MKPNGVWDPDTIMLSERYELALDHLSLSIKGVSYEDRGLKYCTTPTYVAQSPNKCHNTQTTHKFDTLEKMYKVFTTLVQNRLRTGV